MMLMLAVLALAAAEPPADDAASNIAELQQMYDQSCAAREYGAYDDLCDQLSQQLKQARIAADRENRRKAAEARRRPRTPATISPRPSPPTPTPTPTTVSPPSATGQTGA